jgi:hypothetical protein
MGIGIKDVLGAVSPVYGAVTGEGAFGDLLGKKSEMKEDEAKKVLAAAEQKVAEQKAASQARAQQAANQARMKKGGSVKKMADGGKVPQDIDGASATRSPKKGEKPTYEEPGSGIRVDGKPLNKAKGGMVSSSASRRADGIASKGKTRGKMC